MKLNAAIFTIITFLTSTILFANTLSLENNDDGTWNVNYSSDGPIGGFQFNVDGATLTDASGGLAGSAGFLISTSATTALGFSLTGATIPEGEGTLIIISVDGSPTGLSGIVVSDPVGQDMGFSYDDGGDDVFVHISVVQESGLGTLNDNDHVNFEIVENRGKNAASNLSKIDSNEE